MNKQYMEVKINMNCRGHEKRKSIVRDYQVKPEAHVKLLPNKIIKSDAGGNIENEYYLFSARKKGGNRTELIQCGMGAARDFLVLLNHPGLPLFNPLKSDESHRELSGTQATVNARDKEKWNETAKQLYNAIMWLFILWDVKPNTPLFNIKDEVIQNKNNEPSLRIIKSVNTMIRNGEKGEKLTNIIDACDRNKNIINSKRNFTLLKKKIEEIVNQDGEGIESFF